VRLMLLDGNSLANRAYYGIRPLTNAQGLFTHAIYGFLSIYQRLLSELKPDAVCVAFDLHAPTFRHEMYEGYKAQRKGMPEELAVQMPVLKEVLDALGVKRCELEGYEADDIIGTFSVKCAQSGCECVIVTGDRDSFQLITDSTHVYHVRTKGGRTETTDYSRERFVEEYGFEPPSIVDLKALMGDSSDNIPGVAGVGEKTAMDLIRRFGTLEKVYENIASPDIKDSVRKKLEAGRESAKMSYELALIDKAVPIDLQPEDCLLRGYDAGRLVDLFKTLGFNSLIDRWRLRELSVLTPEKTVEDVAAELLDSEEKARALLEKAAAAEYVSAVFSPELDAAAVCVNGKTAVALADTLPDYDGFLRGLCSAGIKKAAHGVKDILVSLAGRGIRAEGFDFDTEIAAYLLAANEGNYTLGKLAAAYCGEELPEEKLFTAPNAFSPLGGRDEAVRTIAKYAAEAYRLRGELAPRLESKGVKAVFEKIEMPLCPVLADMEEAGFLVDRSALREFGQQLSTGIDVLQGEIYALAGEKFNINSTKQLGEILFEKMGIPPVKKTKSGYSTDAAVLEKLAVRHPIADALLEYRRLTKLKSTYADALDRFIAPDGRIHTKFNMTATATGRLSSAEPNLQNIPIRSQLGGEIRKMFVAAPGMLLVDADYSQIELRILAHISGDEEMIKAFAAGEDIHRVTAAQVFGVAPEEVTPIQRSRAKAVNFGIVYGIGAFSLSKNIGVSVREAQDYIDGYLAHYSGVRRYMKEAVEKAKASGYAATVFGRRRDMPELTSSNRNMRAFGERVALNMPVQGTAADIMKLAMIRAAERIKAEKLRARIILQVHDELIAECPPEEEERVKKLLSEEMEGAVKLSVPLTAEAHSGLNWYDAK